MANKTLLVFPDKLGITDGYEGQWNMLLIGAKLDGYLIQRVSIWRSWLVRKQLLVKRPNRKMPGFNPEIIHEVRHWFEERLHESSPAAVLIMDPALFGLVESRWESATTDKLRGGVYPYTTAKGFQTTIVITVPISAINRRMDKREIAALNDGAYSRQEWDDLQKLRSFHTADESQTDDSEGADDDGDETPEDSSTSESEDAEEVNEAFFMPPYKIPYGRFVLRVDLGKLRRAADGSLARQPRFIYKLVTDPVVADEAYETLSKCILIAADCETHPLDKKKPSASMTCIGYSGLTESGDAATFVFPIWNGKSVHAGMYDNCENNWATIRKIHELPIRMTFQNGGYDAAYFVLFGVPIENWAYDSMEMFWSIWPELPKRLDFITSVLSDSYQYWKSDIRSDSIHDYWKYCGKDTYTTLCDTLILAQLLLDDPRAARNFAEAHARVAIGFAISMRGNRTDMVALEAHGITLNEKKAKAQAELRYLIADDEFNVNSVPQRKRLIYDLLGVQPRNAKGKIIKDKDKASTGAMVLRSVMHENPIVRRVVLAMAAVTEPSKQISNVIGIRQRPVGEGNFRFFTAYDGVGTTTTRYSSRQSPFYDGGNGQNIRKDYRDWITADPDSIFLDVDFSAADDVYISFESGDERKIELFRSGRDAHAVNATLFFDNWTYDMVVKGKKAEDERVVHPIRGIRQITKKLSHGCNYLMAAMTLYITSGREAIVAAAKELGHANAGLWSVSELVEFCESLEHKYRAYYTRLRRSGGWYGDVTDELVKTRGVTTAFGYFQRFLSDPRDDDVLRAAAATLGQANTAGRINDTVMELDYGWIRPAFRDGPNPHAHREPLRVTRERHGISIRLQTHDSLTFNVSLKHPNWIAGCQRIIEVMSRPTVIRNKSTGQLEEFVVKTEAEIGLRWGKIMVPWDGNADSIEAAVIEAQKKNAAYIAKRQLILDKHKLTAGGNSLVVVG